MSEMTKIKVHYTTGSTDISDLPPRSVALDGCVRGPVMGDDQDRWSFDHHDDCHRLITSATCEQVWTATKLGFQWGDREVWVNDLDGDTVLSLFAILASGVAIQHPDGTVTAPPPYRLGLGSLVRAIALVDAHGPSANVLMGAEDRKLVTGFYNGVIYPTLGRDIQERFDEWDGLLKGCFSKIHDLLTGDLVVPETKDEPVEIIEQSLSGSGLKIVIAKCDGFGGFTKLYDEGYDVVILASDAANDSTRFTIGKVSDLVPFDLSALLTALNEIEDGWGGGSSIAGSPRLPDGESSHLLTKDVFHLATEALKESA